MNPEKYDLISLCVDGVAVAIKDGTCEIVSGDEVIRVPDDAQYVSGSIWGIYLAKNEDYVAGYLGADGNWRIPLGFYDARSFHFGMAVVRESKRGLYKVINVRGEDVFPVGWDHVSNFSEQGAVGRKGDEWFLLRASGEVTRLGAATSMRPPSEGVIARSRAGKAREEWGFVDLVSNPILENEVFGSVGRFSSGICAVKKGRAYRFLGLDGNYLCDKEFKDAGVFHKGVCPVRSLVKGEKWGAVNVEGEWVIDPIYDGCEHLPIDSSGNGELCGDLIQVWTGNFVLDNGKMGYYDFEGREVWKPRK